jgi:omega-6 fatty acid desaturase (delta-12 desaturase)
MEIKYEKEMIPEKEQFFRVTAMIKPFRARDTSKVMGILCSSVVAFLFFLGCSFYAYDHWKWFCLLFAIPAICFYVRMFAVLHDCAHQSFFKRRFLNDCLGHFIGIFFYTPFSMWQDGHHKHHVHSGNLDKRDNNPDVWLMTVREYKRAPARVRLAYRLFRHPFVYLTIVPIALFLLVFRLPSKYFSAKINLNIILLDLFIVLSYILAAHTIGLSKFIILHAPICIAGFTIGAFMFYLQHQFEDSYYAPDESFIFEKASLKGSSFYKFHPFFNWMTGSVGYHHIHHLNPGIPMYNLNRAHDAIMDSYPVQYLTFWEGIKTFRLKLWDEDNQKMVPFPG